MCGPSRMQRHSFLHNLRESFIIPLSGGTETLLLFLITAHKLVCTLFTPHSCTSEHSALLYHAEDKQRFAGITPNFHAEALAQGEISSLWDRHLTITEIQLSTGTSCPLK